MSQHPDNQAHAAAFAAEVAHLRAARIAGQSGRLLDLFERVPVHCPVRIGEAACPQWASLDIQ